MRRDFLLKAIFLLLIISGCASRRPTYLPEEGGLLPYNLIEDKGIRGIRADYSTEKDVVAAFGQDFVTEWPDSNTCSISYPSLGLSFWYLKRDSMKTIDRICADPNIFHGFTGIGLPVDDNLHVRDVLKMYHDSKFNWSYDQKYGALDLDFDDVGITFRVQPDSNLLAATRFLADHADSLLTGIYIDHPVVQVSVPW